MIKIYGTGPSGHGTTTSRTRRGISAAFSARHPTVIAGITGHFQPGRTVDDLFRDCLQLIIDPAAGNGRERR